MTNLVKKVRKRVNDLTKGPNKLIYIACLIILYIVLAFIIIWETTHNINVIVSGSSALLGAAAAFMFSILILGVERRSKNKAYLVKTKYLVDKSSKFNKQVEVYVNKYIKHINTNFSWANIPIMHLFFSWSNIDTSDLLFLLDYEIEGKQILDTIFSVDTKTQLLINILDYHNKNYSSRLEKIESGNYGKENISIYELENIMGKKLFHESKDCALILIDTNKTLLQDCNDAEEKIDFFLNNHL